MGTGQQLKVSSDRLKKSGIHPTIPEKSDKKQSEDYIQTICISSDIDQHTSEVSKESV